MRAVGMSLVEVIEVDAPADAEPIVWRLLTTHAVEDAAMAWRVIGWYRQRWTIEQFFRTLKQQGLQREDSPLESAERHALQSCQQSRRYGTGVSRNSKTA